MLVVEGDSEAGARSGAHSEWAPKLGRDGGGRCSFRVVERGERAVAISDAVEQAMASHCRGGLHAATRTTLTTIGTTPIVLGTRSQFPMRP